MIKLLRKYFRIRTIRIKVQYIGPTITETMALAYAQACGWIQMVNYVTWTLASAFVLASLVSITSTLQRTEFDEIRLVMPIVWVPLCIAWFVFDRTYVNTAKVARAVVNRIENGFPPGMKPLSSQSVAGRTWLTRTLYFIVTFILGVWAAIFALAVDSRIEPDRSYYKQMFAPPSKPSADSSNSSPTVAPAPKPCG